jgi:hypothetical protein
MRNKPLKAAQPDVRALRHDLRAADDEKIKRVVAMLDAVADPHMNQLSWSRCGLGWLRSICRVRCTFRAFCSCRWIR